VVRIPAITISRRNCATVPSKTMQTQQSAAAVLFLAVSLLTAVAQSMRLTRNGLNASAAAICSRYGTPMYVQTLR
jgi:hypothetical protein